MGVSNDELQQLLRRNPQLSVGDSGQAAKLERRAGHESLATRKAQERNSERLLVRVVSIRKRLLDEDNLCEKYLVDCLRYIGAIPGDEPEKVKIETSQRKAEKGEQEQTLVEILTTGINE